MHVKKPKETIALTFDTFVILNNDRSKSTQVEIYTPKLSIAFQGADRIDEQEWITAINVFLLE